ncbi:MAG TPA: hypothetical protein VD794_02775, partial [Flavisolibacter sp.]|nr:hypothetical protein [Flavisolibacter sp.]
MPTHIKCPACSTSFDVQDVLSADVEQKLKLEYEKRLQDSLSQIDAERKKLTEQEEEFEKKRRNQNELFRQQLEKEKQKLEAQAIADKQKLEVELQQQIRKSITQDFENQLRILKQSDEEKEEKLRAAQKKELEFMKKEQE